MNELLSVLVKWYCATFFNDLLAQVR